jgi:hypothetical protein
MNSKVIIFTLKPPLSLTSGLLSKEAFDLI